MIIISADKNQGKTTQIKKIVAYLKEKNIAIGGFYSEKVFDNQKFIGYDVIMVETNKSYAFLRLKGNNTQQRIGDFFIDEFALAEGIIQIKKAITDEVKAIFIDEIGKLELKNRGWTVAINNLLHSYKGKIIIAIRVNFVQDILKKWKLTDVEQYTTSEDDYKKIISKF